MSEPDAATTSDGRREADLTSDTTFSPSGRAQDFAGAARAHAATYVEKRKADAIGAVADIADAIRTSGEGFKDHPNIKAFFDQAAVGIDELSDTIKQRSFSEIYDEVEFAARRRPMVAAAAAAVAGFTLWRFLQTRRPRPLPRSRAPVPTSASRGL